MSFRAVLRAPPRTGLSGADGRVGEGSDARGSVFEVGGGPGQALAVMGAPELVAVGPDNELGGDGDDGELGGGGGVNAGDALTSKGVGQVGGRAGGTGAGRRGRERVRRAHRFLASGGQGTSAWQGHQPHSAGVLGAGAAGVMLVVADLPGDRAEAGRGEAGRALRHRDMGTGDGVQVEVLVQGAEDAGGQVIGRRLGCRGDGFGTGQWGSPVPGGADAMPTPAGGVIGWRPGMKPWSFGIKKTFVRLAANGVRSGRRWR